MQENETEALSFDKKTLLLSVNKNYVHIHENEDTPGREKYTVFFDIRLGCY